MNRILVIGCLALASFAMTAAAEAPKKRVYGWVEKAVIEELDAEVKVKLDSGALTSSMHAEEIERFERDGEDWVRFTIELKDERDGDQVEKRFEKPLFRRLKVYGAGGSDSRPVVLLRLCIGDTVYEEQFSLRDRGDMNYPVLLGRRTIQHLGLLDVSKTFLHQPDCDGAPVSDIEEREADEDIGV